MLLAVAQVVLLGTGTPNADPERSGPSVAILSGGATYLVDAGPGVVRRAAAAKISLPSLRRVFLTHLHSDHTLGLADLMFSPWVLERKDPLEVYGPPGTRSMTQHLSSAYREDIRMRLSGGEPTNKTGWRTIAREIRPGVVWRDENVAVTAFAVSHGTWKHAYGYRFDAGDRSIVISGDTGPAESIIVDACRGCDILVHEVYSTTGFAKRTPEWQKYHAAFHTSSAELAAIATRAKPKLLVLYHQLFWGTSDGDLLDEVRRGYTGKVVNARDLDVF
jgi:ribonuclease BN (tRNA processing enzyme)